MVTDFPEFFRRMLFTCFETDHSTLILAFPLLSMAILAKYLTPSVHIIEQIFPALWNEKLKPNNGTSSSSQEIQVKRILNYIIK